MAKYAHPLVDPKVIFLFLLTEMSLTFLLALKMFGGRFFLLPIIVLLAAGMFFTTSMLISTLRGRYRG